MTEVDANEAVLVALRPVLELTSLSSVALAGKMVHFALHHGEYESNFTHISESRAVDVWPMALTVAANWGDGSLTLSVRLGRGDSAEANGSRTLDLQCMHGHRTLCSTPLTSAMMRVSAKSTEPGATRRGVIAPNFLPVQFRGHEERQPWDTKLNELLDQYGFERVGNARVVVGRLSESGESLEPSPAEFLRNLVVLCLLKSPALALGDSTSRDSGEPLWSLASGGASAPAVNAPTVHPEREIPEAEDAPPSKAPPEWTAWARDRCARQGGIARFNLGELRDALGYGRLGKRILEEIESGLSDGALGFFPTWMLDTDGNEKPRQSDWLWVYTKDGSPLSRVIDCLLDCMGDRASQEEVAALLPRVRLFSDEEQTAEQKLGQIRAILR